MSLKGLKPTILTYHQYNDLEECNCGKPLFKYVNTSKNHYISKCMYIKEEYDIKTKKWITSKKQPCNALYIYYGERPVFKEINQKIGQIAPTLNLTNLNKNLLLDKNKILEKRLREMFTYLLVSSHSSTLDEINLIVKNNLKRETLKTFYSPTTKLWMKEVCKESFEDYQTRIFSKKIVDLDYQNYNNENVKIDKIVKIVKTKPIKNTVCSQFIVTSDSENDSESEAESEVESEIDIEDNRADSDVDDIEDIEDIEENEEAEDIFEEMYDDVEDQGDSYDYNDE